MTILTTLTKGQEQTLHRALIAYRKSMLEHGYGIIQRGLDREKLDELCRVLGVSSTFIREKAGGV